ncbi:dihydrofolate reductase [Lactobacillus corticis]|uniref:Dihydrofolate reductase n=1 Tax=Lactobacillus corticis TaxID=2201249 RepID=A0A916QJE0_9LACO|nr:dihydrofolate reductase [Lactobacillus corticis]GFZ27668.1 dihydrofolate reductase [Lactobacillus corticis]
MLTFVWAEDELGNIGYQGHLPWHLPADLQHFKAVTMHKPMIMGRKTFDSFPGILPGRKHLVLSHDPSLQDKYDPQQVEIVTSVDELQEIIAAYGDQEICLIGGSGVFALFVDQVDRLEKTLVYGQFPADTKMVPINYENFTLVKRSDFKADAKNPYDYSFLTYQRKSQKS